MNSLRLPLFDEVRRAENVLIAGAGGGFDVFSGLPLYFTCAPPGKTSFSQTFRSRTCGRTPPVDT